MVRNKKNVTNTIATTPTVIDLKSSDYHNEVAWKYNEAGFINIENYLTALNPNWENLDIFIMFNAVRNIGKSWGAWAYIERKWKETNYQWRVAYCRTNKEKLKNARESFNARYRGLYYMSESKIYKQTFDEKGKEILSQRIEIGSVFSLNQEENYKSGWFINHHMFFWDEYNEETTQIGVFDKAMQLLLTIKRDTTPFLVLLVGNKVSAKDDVMTHMEIDLDEIKDPTIDYFFELIPNYAYFVDVGSSTFKSKNPETGLIQMLSKFSEKSDRMVNSGGYLNEQYDNIILYRKYVEPTKQILKYFALDEYKFEYGEFTYKDGRRHSYFKEVHKVPKGHFAHTLSIIADMRITNAGLMLSDDMQDLAESLKKKAKNKMLWYCSVDAKNLIEPFIRMNVKLE